MAIHLSHSSTDSSRCRSTQPFRPQIVHGARRPSLSLGKQARIQLADHSTAVCKQRSINNRPFSWPLLSKATSANNQPEGQVIRHHPCSAVLPESPSRDCDSLAAPPGVKVHAVSQFSAALAFPIGPAEAAPNGSSQFPITARSAAHRSESAGAPNSLFMQSAQCVCEH